MSNSPFSRRNLMLYGYVLAITCYGLSTAYYATGNQLAGARFLIPGSAFLLASSLLRLRSAKQRQKQSGKPGKSNKKK